MTYISFLLGILFMSVIASIGILIFDDGKDYATLFMGPVMWVMILCVWLYDVINKYIRYHDVRSLMICPDGELRYIKDELADTMLECADMKYDFPKFQDHPEWDVNDWKKEFTWCNIGNMRYTPKKVWSQYEPISKEEIEYAKEHPYIYKGDGD